GAAGACGCAAGRWAAACAKAGAALNRNASNTTRRADRTMTTLLITDNPFVKTSTTGKPLFLPQIGRLLMGHVDGIRLRLGDRAAGVVDAHAEIAARRGLADDDRPLNRRIVGEENLTDAAVPGPHAEANRPGRVGGQCGQDRIDRTDSRDRERMSDRAVEQQRTCKRIG